MQLKMETENMWEHKVGNNANTANFVWVWKTRMSIMVADTSTFSEETTGSIDLKFFWGLE